jgi:hypothetical protein
MTADRYVLRSLHMDKIYPGTLAGIEQAMVDAQYISRQFPGQQVTLMYRCGNQSTIMGVYEDGERVPLDPEDDSADN